MNVLVDDIGSFPLPPGVDRKSFDSAYRLARAAIIDGKNPKDDENLYNNFYRVVVDSFIKKLYAGLDVVNYPQHYSMYDSFLDAIHEATDRGTYRIDEKQAVIPEVFVINEEAKRLHEKTGKKILLRVCITGPIELYLKEMGTLAYKDVLLMFADSVRAFAKNSILDSKYVKTYAVSIDEPSIGYTELNTRGENERNMLIEVLSRAFDFPGVTKHTHLHSLSRVSDILDVPGIDVLTCEYASSPKNIDSLSRDMLERADKFIRVGIARTDINSIIAGLYEKGIKEPTAEQLVEPEEVIRKRFLTALEKYEDRMTFTGPDCGLGGWDTQESAQLVLKRTVNAVKGKS